MFKMNNSESEGLMLVEDPRETLRTLCKFNRRIVDWVSYKREYEKLVGRKHKPISKQHADTHFYMLTLFRLFLPLESGEKGQYKLSPTALALCKFMGSNEGKYKQILAGILLNNKKKGALFRNFLDFVGVSRTIEKIEKKFKSMPSRTLKKWCKEAGLIEISDSKRLIWALPQGKRHYSIKEFRKKLVQAYNEMMDTGIFGVRRIYVKISELRVDVCYKFNLSFEEFDGYLKNLLSSPMGKKIRFYGAPTGVFESDETFAYNGKSYVYMSIKV